MSAESPETIVRKFEKINENAAERCVVDSIDRPIRGLVFQINRLGIPTVFSCCGFNYHNEEEIKSHADNAYIQFTAPRDHPLLTNLLNFIDAALSQGWCLR